MVAQWAEATIDTAEIYGSEPMVGEDIKVCDPV